MAARIDFNIADNADEAFPLTFTDANGAGIDYSGSTWQMDLKHSADDAEPALSLSSAGGGIDDSAAASGTITITFPAGGLAPGIYLHDLLRVDGPPERLAAGTVTVTKGITVLA